MNVTTIVKALEFVIENRHEIASDAEAFIHFVRRVEHLTVKHDTTPDHVLVAADTWLTQLKEMTKPQTTE